MAGCETPDRSVRACTVCFSVAGQALEDGATSGIGEGSENLVGCGLHAGIKREIRLEYLLQIGFQSVDQVFGGSGLFLRGVAVRIEDAETDMSFDNLGHQ